MAFASTYSSISSTQTQADKPLDTVLMDALRQNQDFLFEWMGGTSYTPSTAHTHNGTDAALVSGVADNAITLSKLSMSTGSGSGVLGGGAAISLAVTRYAHYHQSLSHDLGAGGPGQMAVGCSISSAVANGIGMINVLSTISSWSLTWDYHSTSGSAGSS